MRNKPISWTVLGRVIGTATDWDQADTYVLQLYNFVPAVGVDLPDGCVTIGLESGKVESFDDKGRVIASKDLIDAVKHLPVVRL